MVTSDLEELPSEWARAWSSSNDSERLLALFTDDCIFEDVTLGVVTRGKEELRGFVNGAFAAIPNFKYELRNWLTGVQWAVIEWVIAPKVSLELGAIGHYIRRAVLSSRSGVGSLMRLGGGDLPSTTQRARRRKANAHAQPTSLHGPGCFGA